MLGDTHADAKVTQGHSGCWQTVVTEGAPQPLPSLHPHLPRPSPPPIFRQRSAARRGDRSTLRSPRSTCRHEKHPPTPAETRGLWQLADTLSKCHERLWLPNSVFEKRVLYSSPF